MNKESTGSKLNTVLLTIVIGILSWNLKTTLDMSYRLQAVEQDKKQSWTVINQSFWAGKLRERNPALYIPDPLETIQATRP